ncbi:metallophosphoesterase family protein [Verrucomicrobia bacterium]|nr:metallophosphoesterase family protein [Verrucomicrobiota bacterium]
MKLLVTSDLHYNLQQFDWLLRIAERYDYVIIAGDLLNVAGYLELELQITVVAEYLQSLSQRTQVIVCSGNHDGDTKTTKGEYTAAWLQGIRSDTLFVDCQSVQAKGVLFSVCPWWDGPHSRKDMADMLVKHAQLPHEKWVWIHHAPPDQCRVSWTGKRYGGDKFLNQLIETHSPTVVFSGHIHTAPFYQAGGWVDRINRSWVCNPGSQPGPMPTTIQFDLEKMSAVFDSSEGRETADLSDLDVLPFDHQ